MVVVVDRHSPFAVFDDTEIIFASIPLDAVRSIRATCPHDQQKSARLRPYAWVHPDNDDRR